MAEPSTDSPPPQTPLGKAIAGLGLRGIGPAFMGGRIADIAIHPSNPTTWYVAVGSGGVWRTTNAGITWKPIFDDQPSYSIGCVRIDPTRPEVIWVGTGEAVSGRHVAWGDGVYRSRDGGESWERMGLERSEHISDILIDPRNGDVVYVAAEGPLWSAGGERGLYRTEDGGRSWERVLHVDDNTGITSAVFAPDDPDTIYAASYERRRRVWSFVGGGPGSGIHRSGDGGTTWNRMTTGLPKGHMGRIGLAVTPADPHLVYATIEAAEEDERGFYRSTNRGHTWERRNKYISGGTGPHYYQELFASPTDPHKVFQVDVYLHVTADGGTTFRQVEDAKHKHSDNHVVWIDPHNGDHLIVGCDAGIYETFDEGLEWRHVSNLPIAQFYRVAVDNSEPFTTVLAGAQDLGTIRGPLRTASVDGVRNQDWWVPLGADGYHVAFDPHDDDVSYLEYQIGNVMRHDRRTGELVDIQPQAAHGEPAERWNWDSPIVVSAHRAGRVYVASQRIWRSDDRGDSWKPISPDLTSDRNRYELAVTDRVVSVDALYDHVAMSFYSTVSVMAESPIDENLLYVGTDDGVLQVTEDGGASWREATLPTELPSTAFINGITPSLHEVDTVLVAADDHKSGDYTPYLFRSDDRGTTWRSIRGDLPDGTILWCVRQDHERSDLLFVGAEHGVHVSLNGGERWHRLAGDVPTIAFRDLAIQRRDDDLVCASFGRGIYVLDDYGPLRAMTDEMLSEPFSLFPVRDAWWYVPYQPMQAIGQPTLGSTAFRAPNPPFGATFTYHVSDEILDSKGERRKREEDLARDGGDVEFPGWDRLRAEHVEVEPSLRLVIRDESGTPVRSIAADTSAGLHRSSWDLRRPAAKPIDLKPPDFRPPWDTEPVGPLVPPGRYSVELELVQGESVQTLTEPQSFEVGPIPGREDHDPAAEDFAGRTADLARRVEGAAKTIDSARSRITHVRATVLATPGGSALAGRVQEVHRRLETVAATILGDPVLERLGEPPTTSIRSAVRRVASLHWNTTGGPTETQQAVIEQAAASFETAASELAELVETELPRLTADLDAAGGTWTER